MLNMDGRPAPHDVSLWFYTDWIDHLYRVSRHAGWRWHTRNWPARPLPLKELNSSRTSKTCSTARQFWIRDLNGYYLYSFSRCSHSELPTPDG
jgi:hypothetical protein